MNTLNRLLRRALILALSLIVPFSILVFNGCINKSVIDDIYIDEPDIPEEPGKIEKDPDFIATCHKIIENIVKEETGGLDINSLDKAVEDNLKKLNPDGSVKGLDYTVYENNEWNLRTHFDVLLSMAKAFALPKSKYYKDMVLLERIADGLIYWDDANPKAANWWNIQVGIAKPLGVILALTRSGEDPKLSSKVLGRMVRYMQLNCGDVTKQTGANAIDIALHWICRGAVWEDQNTLNTGLQEAFKQLNRVSSNQEGIQYDDCFFQHGPQLYIGGYGTVFLDGILKIVQYANGSKFALAGEQLATFQNLVKGIMLKSLRGKSELFNEMGRSVSRPEASDTRFWLGRLDKLAEADPANASIYQKNKTWIETKNYSGAEESLTQYFVGDFTLYQGPAYTMSVRSVSSRTSRCETGGNGENLKGYYISDGSTAIQRTGEEYFDIYPVWDWNMVPGVTALYQKTTPKGKDWGQLGNTNFTGGVSNGKIGNSVYKVDNSNDKLDLKANKSWFFWGKEVVAMGSGITSKATEEVRTSVNQCLYKSGASYLADDIKTPVNLNSAIANKNIRAIWNDGIAYFFPDGQKVNIAAQNKTENWKTINTTKNKIQNMDVLTLWLGHGANPSQSTYSYVIVPGMSEAEIQTYKVKSEILANQEGLHAVRNDGVTQIAFFSAGTLTTDELELTVDKPCVMIVKPTNNGANIEVADPSHSLKELTIILKSGNKQTSRNTTVFASDGTRKGQTHSLNLTF